MAYLVCIEAPDASGKSTQIRLLEAALRRDGIPVKIIKFPRYGTDGCKPVELYLGGALGRDPSDTSAYAASTLFAVDRYVSYRTEWQSFVEKGDGVLLLDRYTGSNAVHQLSKLDEAAERTAFLDWLYDFEFTKLGLPKPDDTIFLDVPTAVSRRLMAKRAEKDSTHLTDIHERDAAYLARCYDAAKFAAEKLGWHTLVCTDEKGDMRSAEDIADELYRYVKTRLAADNYNN